MANAAGGVLLILTILLVSLIQLRNDLGKYRQSLLETFGRESWFGIKTAGVLLVCPFISGANWLNIESKIVRGTVVNVVLFIAFVVIGAFDVQ